MQRFLPINTLFIKNRVASGSFNIFTGMLRVGKIIFILFFLQAILPARSLGQGCTELGQNPYSAFPVCGTNVFTQTSVPVCGGTPLPTLCNDRAGYGDLNPYWYKFTCYAGGTLGFLITPVDLGDDYDWQLFDITGHDPMDVYKDKSLIVCANWSGTYGITGTSANAPSNNQCASDPGARQTTFSTMPSIIAGHEYLLLISHYSGSGQSGYTLTFPTGASGGTGSIVNPVRPKLVSAEGACDGTEVTVKLNKRVDCKTLALDGSDFTVSGPVPISVTSARANACAIGFDTDTLILKLNVTLSRGNYTIASKLGSDGNTLIDNCANSLPVGDNVAFKFRAVEPTPMDSIQPVICITDTLQLVFYRGMDCSSIAPDGSDFVVTGPAPVSVKSAKGICTDGLTTTIQVFLTAPIRVNGTFTITLKNGTDGNTLVDKCGFVTPPSYLNFTTKNITRADIQSSVGAGCKNDTISLSHDGNGAANSWNWRIDGSAYSTQQTPATIVSKVFGDHTIALTVGNGFCTDTASRIINYPDHTVKAGFMVTDSVCPTKQLLFTDNSSSNVSSWVWNFGNGNSFSGKDPAAQSFPLVMRNTQFTASLTVQNSYNCTDIAYKILTVLTSCYIAVPSAFTPNGDGINDYLYPLNAFKAGNLVFRVFNRYGQIIFETTNWTKKWDGRYQSIPQAPGTYVWTLAYTDLDTGEKVSLKGTTVLIR